MPYPKRVHAPLAFAPTLSGTGTDRIIGTNLADADGIPLMSNPIVMFILLPINVVTEAAGVFD